MEKLIIYTPCSRPQNLDRILESIIVSCGENNFHWIVCYDSENNGDKENTSNITYLNVKDERSRVGNSQRNKCIEYAIENFCHNVFMYCLDDDNIMHYDLCNEILNNTEEDVDMVIFQQILINGKKRMGANEVIGTGQNDTANFAVRLKTIGDVRWVLDRYEADGIFAADVSKNAKNIKRIHKPLCYYNYLDPRRQN